MREGLGRVDIGEEEKEERIKGGNGIGEEDRRIDSAG